MEWMETFSTSSIALKVCVVLAPLQTIVYIIGFSTNYWVAAKLTSLNTGSLGGGSSITGVFDKLFEIKIYEGLWENKLCLMDRCQSTEDTAVADWLHVTRFFATLALIGFLVTTAGVLVCLFVTQLSQRRILHILTCVVAAGTAVLVLVTVAIYGTQYNNPDRRMQTTEKSPSWSYGLCVAALVLDIVTSILLAINVLRKPNI